jgi:2,4-dienoyl-CoA reductase-like NADH-dependent reductase (Old Yellow Enzyme family)
MLFSPTETGGLALKNRLVRSATYDGMADRRGRVSERQLALYEALAAGGVGLIVTGLFSVHPSGRVSGYQNVVSDDSVADGLRRLVQTVHRHGSRIVMQAAHCGREAHLYQTYKNRMALAPSFLSDDPYFAHPHRALTEDEICEIVAAFGEAAGRARAAGFDGVQVHGAHAYLVSQFLSPHTNRRRDGWGGSPEARFRLIAEIYAAMRRRVGSDYPIHVKLGVEDGFGGGLTFSEGRDAARRCAELGFDAVEVSQGLRGHHYSETEFRTAVPGRTPEAYFRHWARDIRSHADVPIVSVGGLRSLEVVRDLIDSGDADLAAMCRPLIREPDLIRRWQQGDGRPSRCVSCNRCFEILFKGLPLHCVVEAGRAARGGRPEGAAAPDAR